MSVNMRKRLRPMGITDILDETAELYKSNFKLFVGIATMAYIPLLLMVPVEYIIANNSSESAATAFAGLTGLLTFLVTTIATGVLALAISDSYLGQKTTISECYNRAFRSGAPVRLIGAAILQALVIFSVIIVPAIAFSVIMTAGAGGFINTASTVIATLLVVLVALIPIVYCAMRLSLFAPAVMLENCGARGALRRSWGLLGGMVLKALAVIALVAVVVVIVQLTLLAPVEFFAVSGQLSPLGVAASSLWSNILSILFAPILSIATILVYYDARIRKEGFDLQVLAADLAARTQQSQSGYAPNLPREESRPAEPTLEEPAKEPEV